MSSNVFVLTTGTDKDSETVLPLRRLDSAVLSKYGCEERNRCGIEQCPALAAGCV